MSAFAWAAAIMGAIVVLGFLIWGVVHIGKALENSFALFTRIMAALTGLAFGGLSIWLIGCGASLEDFLGGAVVLLGLIPGLMAIGCFYVALFRKTEDIQNTSDD